jgi:sugar lactone lactonase YvrE
MTLEFTCLVDLKCRIGESPVYDERTNALYFVDILSRTLYRLDVTSKELGSWTFESEVGSIGLAASGRIVVALRHNVILFDTASQAKQELCRIEEDQAEKTRLNDGRVGPDGAFWVGSMDDRPTKQPIGALYRVEPSGKVERKVDGLLVSNGLAWTAGGETMFHADSRGIWIETAAAAMPRVFIGALACLPAGSIGSRRTAG